MSLRHSSSNLFCHSLGTLATAVACIGYLTPTFPLSQSTSTSEKATLYHLLTLVADLCHPRSYRITIVLPNTTKPICTNMRIGWRYIDYDATVLKKTVCSYFFTAADVIGPSYVQPTRRDMTDSWTELRHWVENSTLQLVVEPNRVIWKEETARNDKFDKCPTCKETRTATNITCDWPRSWLLKGTIVCGGTAVAFILPLFDKAR